MIHIGHVEEFAEADYLVMFLVDALVSLQEILGPIYAPVSTTTFRNTDTIVRIIRIIDPDQPLVTAGIELSEPEGESPLLTHAARVRVGPANSLFPRNNILVCCWSMDDRDFLSLFHDANLPSGEFSSQRSSSPAWLVLSHHRLDEAESIVAREIRWYATASGAANRYHDTLTRFWVRLAGHAM